MMQDCDTLLMVGSSFPYSEFLPEEGKARGVQIDLDGRMVGIRYPMEANLIGDSKLTLRALLPLLERKTDRSWREKIEKGVQEWWQLIEQRAQRAGRADQPAADLPRALKAPARRRDPHLGLGLRRQLVRARREAALGDDGLALGHARHDGPRCPLRDRGEVRLPRPAGDRAGRRRRDADERPRRADHDRQVPRALGRPAADRARAEQPRSQPGHLGAARDVRRPQVRRVAGTARCALRALGGDARPGRHPRR